MGGGGGDADGGGDGDADRGGGGGVDGGGGGGVDGGMEGGGGDIGAGHTDCDCSAMSRPVRISSVLFRLAEIMA